MRSPRTSSIRKKRLNLAALIAFAVTPEAWAQTTALGEVYRKLVPGVLGTDAVRGEGPKALCKVLVASEGKLKNYCSGTLVKAQEVVTAAHCIRDLDAKSRVIVACGASSSTEVSAASVMDGAGFEEIHDAQQAFSASDYVYDRQTDSGIGTDTAILRLKKPFVKVAPMPLATRKDLIAIMGKTPAAAGLECRVGGFGVVFDSRLGALQEARLASAPLRSAFDMGDEPRKLDFRVSAPWPLDVRPEEALQCTAALGFPLDNAFWDNKGRLSALLEAHKASLFSEMTAPGDSGGAVYCRKPPTGAWKLYAVLSQIDYNQETRPPRQVIVHKTENAYYPEADHKLTWSAAK